MVLGDSLTEGVGDPHAGYPNGWRGWAELVADALAEHDPGTEYVNLALRGRRAAQVLADQVPLALAHRPTVVTFWAGGNDLLAPRVSVDAVATTVEQALVALAPTGARLLLLTVFELDPPPVLRAAGARATAYNDRLRVVADRLGADLVDVADLGRDPSLFCGDRVHPGPAGHRAVAERVAARLGVRLDPDGGADAPRRTPPGWAGEAGWWLGSVVPHAWRWATMASSRERARPKWQEPVRVVDRLVGTPVSR